MPYLTTLANDIPAFILGSVACQDQKLINVRARNLFGMASAAATEHDWHQDTQHAPVCRHATSPHPIILLEKMPPRLCRLFITSRQTACSTPSAPPCRVIPSSSLLGADSLRNKLPADPRLAHAAAATLFSPPEPLNDNILRAKPDYAVQHVGSGSCEPLFVR